MTSHEAIQEGYGVVDLWLPIIAVVVVVVAAVAVVVVVVVAVVVAVVVVFYALLNVWINFTKMPQHHNGSC